MPAEIPYLRASEERIARWRERLKPIPAPRDRDRLVGPRRPTSTTATARLRSSQLEPLLATPAVRFVSVQRELRPATPNGSRRDRASFIVGDDLADFSDTAAVLALCDLAICVDTSVAHLAAAMGRPTYVLIPFQPDWRWTADREHSPWYPQARLFRQPAPGDWNSVLDARERNACFAALACYISGTN